LVLPNYKAHLCVLAARLPGYSSADDTQPKEIQGATFFREIRAGLTTFATMAYIIAVNVRNPP
jgi:hypothetical protein